MRPRKNRIASSPPAVFTVANSAQTRPHSTFYPYLAENEETSQLRNSPSVWGYTISD